MSCSGAYMQHRHASFLFITLKFPVIFEADGKISFSCDNEKKSLHCRKQNWMLNTELTLLLTGRRDTGCVYCNCA